MSSSSFSAAPSVTQSPIEIVTASPNNQSLLKCSNPSLPCRISLMRKRRALFGWSVSQLKESRVRPKLSRRCRPWGRSIKRPMVPFQLRIKCSSGGRPINHVIFEHSMSKMHPDQNWVERNGRKGTLELRTKSWRRDLWATTSILSQPPTSKRHKKKARTAVECIIEEIGRFLEWTKLTQPQALGDRWRIS